MRTYLVYGTFGWLVVTGLLHFIVDVVAQHLRGARAPGLATSLYYGLNTSFAFGQVVFGLLCLWLAWRQPGFMGERMAVVLCLTAAAGWLAITFVFMEYWEPKLNAAVFAALLVASVLMS